MPLTQGDLLNKRYRILEVLGHGGMGSVYRAYDENLDVYVAVKENLFTTEDYARQFRLEANILASLRHPNLPRVSDHFIMPDEGQYLVMDYIEGPDLRQILEKDGPIGEEEGIRIGAAICEALSFLHTRNPAVLHRDIKLGNIKLTLQGDIFLVDFGLAKIIAGDQPTMTGARAMTPGYSSPEQYGSSRTDARSDVYSLGATLYAAMTGFIPEDSLSRALEGLELTPLRKRNPRISERLANVIEKAMQTAPADRYQSAQEFKNALLDISPPAPLPPPSAEPVSAPAAPPLDDAPPVSMQKKSSGRARPFIFLGVVVLLALAGLFVTSPGIFAGQPPVSASPSVTVSASATQANSPEPASVSTSTATLTASPTSTSKPVSTATATLTATDTAQPSPTLPPTATPQGGGAGQITFASMRDGSPQIYTMNPDGSDQTQLFVSGDGACQPRWSPDGTRLAYVSPCAGRGPEYPNASIWVYNFQTGEKTTIPSETGGDFDPSWSPNGKSLVFTSLRDSTLVSRYAQIYRIDLAEEIIKSQPAIRLSQTDASQPARQPFWSRDGQSIYYSIRRNGLWQIWQMSTAGGNSAQVLRNGGNLNDTQPVLNIEGLSIFLTRFGESLSTPPSLVRLDLDSGETVSFRLPIPLREADSSPDGLWLVAEGSNGSNIDIYLLNLLTLELVPLTSAENPDFDPVWRP